MIYVNLGIWRVIQTAISKISNLHLQALGLRCLHMIAGIIIKTGICKDKHRHK